MDSPIVRATLQGALLSGLSNILAQCITVYRSRQPIISTFNRADLVNFVLFSLISGPPNYIWQAWLEAAFPGYTDKLSPLEKEKLIDDSVSGHKGGTDQDATLQKRNAGDAGATTTSNTPAPTSSRPSQKRLNVTNTAIKFALDQTFGAVFNTFLFIAGIALLRGYGLSRIQSDIHEQFWPMIFAGQKLWPAVSVLQFTLVPLEYRTLVGGLVGLGWGVYLSFLAGEKR